MFFFFFLFSFPSTLYTQSKPPSVCTRRRLLYARRTLEVATSVPTSSFQHLLPSLCHPTLHPPHAPTPTSITSERQNLSSGSHLGQERYPIFFSHQHPKFCYFPDCAWSREQETCRKGGRGGREWDTDSSPKTTSVKVKHGFKVGIDSISWASGGPVSHPRPGGAGPFQAVLARGLSTHAESHSDN